MSTPAEHLRNAERLLALAADRDLTDERRAAQVAEAQARAVVGVLAWLDGQRLLFDEGPATPQHLLDEVDGA